jgi:sigma-B regulation protein RsbQ
MESNFLGWSQAMAPNIMGTPDRPELADELTDSFCRTDPAKALVFARTTFLSDNRDDLHRVSVPTLVIECAHDTLAPREVGAFVHEQIAGSALVTLEATGHCPHLSAPEATARAIAAFARQT